MWHWLSVCFGLVRVGFIGFSYVLVVILRRPVVRCRKYCVVSNVTMNTFIFNAREAWSVSGGQVITRSPLHSSGKGTIVYRQPSFPRIWWRKDTRSASWESDMVPCVCSIRSRYTKEILIYATYRRRCVYISNTSSAYHAVPQCMLE